MELKGRFEQMDDDELLRRYRSGDMTALASAVASEVLRERDLPVELPPAPVPILEHAPSGVDRPGDVVCLTQIASPVQADLLCGLLQSEGIDATPADSNLIRVNPMLTQALGGIRIMVRESDLERAQEIMLAFRRGDFALSSDD